MKYVIGAVLAFSVCSNIWLWINLWNLKDELFDFEKRMISRLKNLTNGFVGATEVKLDGQKIAQATRDMCEAFQQAMRDSSKEDL